MKCDNCGKPLKKTNYLEGRIKGIRVRVCSGKCQDEITDRLSGEATEPEEPV